MDDKSEFVKFSKVTARLLNVSKEELNRREAEWKNASKQLAQLKQGPPVRAKGGPYLS